MDCESQPKKWLRCSSQKGDASRKIPQPC
jgi:hypothetical protein